MATRAQTPAAAPHDAPVEVVPETRLAPCPGLKRSEESDRPRPGRNCSASSDASENPENRLAPLSSGWRAINPGFLRPDLPPQVPQPAQREDRREGPGHAQREQRPDEEVAAGGRGERAADAPPRHVDGGHGGRQQRAEKEEHVARAASREQQRGDRPDDQDRDTDQVPQPARLETADDVVSEVERHQHDGEQRRDGEQVVALRHGLALPSEARVRRRRRRPDDERAPRVAPRHRERQQRQREEGLGDRLRGRARHRPGRPERHRDEGEPDRLVADREEDQRQPAQRLEAARTARGWGRWPTPPTRPPTTAPTLLRASAARAMRSARRTPASGR